MGVDTSDIDILKSRGDIPTHVAIIMDGNGRWAQRLGKPRVYGHYRGVQSVRSAVEFAGKLGVDFLTVFAFSDENWKRSPYEVNAIMSLLETYVKREKGKLKDSNIRLQIIGSLSRLPTRTAESLKSAADELSSCTGMTLNVAVSYGGRGEIIEACRSLASKVQQGTLQIEDIDQEKFSQSLWTANIPDPDLLIRTSGEMRISNFLLWQMAYTELYFVPEPWPEFNQSCFLKAVEAFQKRERRYGREKSPSTPEGPILC